MLLDIQGTAEYLATTERHVRRLVIEKKLAHVKIGGKLRFSVRDLAAYIESNRVEATPALRTRLRVAR